MATRLRTRTSRPPLSWAQNYLNLMFSARYRVEGNSMSPTLAAGQSVLVTRPDFPWNRLRRGDVVVLRRPAPPEGTYIKRIVGLPGEEVKMAGGRVYADDLLLPEEYLASGPPAYPGREKVIDRSWWNGPDEVFVLGDNRQDSEDSRTFGPVSLDLVIGRAWCRSWPVRKWGIVR